MARSITNPDWQAQALTAVVQAVAGTDPDRAETVARSIINPGLQARALAAVVRAVASTDPGRAGRVLGEVLAADSWLALLSVLAKHWPQVVLRCVDALSGNERSRDI
ncbi:hypothetical protein [Actinoplanes teichomyceticus]|uniref:hypothetical protein n=1 Tax=Actinoplanes teichomyceticus TaxID=1867 RepID=UPI000F0A3A30|nr:hypothetical protein [Actinoplanes teichomyceticus]